MTEERNGNLKCVEELLKPARKVNDNDLQTLKTKEVGERVQLWTKIKKNLSKYEDMECGEFDEQTHRNTTARFIMAQLKLAATFFMNQEKIMGAEKVFTQAEIDLVIKLEKYNSLDIKSSEEVRTEIRRGDKAALNHIKNYMHEMEGSLEKVLSSPEIKLPVRLAIKETMKKRIEVLDAGVAEFVHIIETKEQQALDEKKKEIKDREEMVKEKEKELEAQRKRLGKITREMEEVGESRFVTRAEAKYMELNYIGRFETKATTFPMTILSPIEGKEYRISSWDEHSRFSDREWMEKMFSAILSKEKIDNEMPRNQRSVYSKNRGMFFRKKEKRIVVEAIVFNHLDAYAEVGFDRKPLSLEEFAGILSKSIDNAELGNYFHVIGIASPTGISEKIREYQESKDFHHRFSSRSVSVCLVDLTTGEIIYNSADANISRFVDLFKPEFDLEAVERLKSFIINKLSTADYVVLEKIAEETGDDKVLVKKAFYDLEKERYRVWYIEDSGFVLQAERGR